MISGGSIVSRGHNRAVQRRRRDGANQIRFGREADVFRLKLVYDRKHEVLVGLLHRRFGNAAPERAQLRRFHISREPVVQIAHVHQLQSLPPHVIHQVHLVAIEDGVG